MEAGIANHAWPLSDIAALISKVDELAA